MQQATWMMVMFMFMMQMCDSTNSNVRSVERKVVAVASEQASIKSSLDAQTRAIEEQTRAINALNKTLEERLPAR